MPYSYLPDSIKENCKVVYITRDPKDTLVSQWHMYNKIFRDNQDPLTLERAGEIFCSGEIPYEPFWDHVLEYCEASQDLHHDPKPQVRKLASFLGKPFGEGDDDAQVRTKMQTVTNPRFANQSGVQMLILVLAVVGYALTLLGIYDDTVWSFGRSG
ncbi:Cytosolic sulfotransferase 3 [Linum perenne]